MVTQHRQTTAIIDADITFPPLFEEIENLDSPNILWQNTETFFEFGFTAGTIVESRSFPLDERKKSDIQKPSAQSPSALLELNLEEEFSGTQQQHLAFPTLIEQVSEIIDFADEDVMDIMRSRAVEQEVLDLLDEPISR